MTRIPDRQAIIAAEKASAAPADIATKWPEDTLQQLQSPRDGLANRDVDERLEKYWPNIIALEARHGAVLYFLTLLASSGQVNSDTPIGYFAAICRSKAAGDRLPSTQCSLVQL